MGWKERLFGEPTKITPEMLRELKLEDMEYDWEDGEFVPLHYSQKGGHKARTEAHHGRSARRDNRR